MRIIVGSVARTELRTSVRWYEEQRAGLGGEFRAAVVDSFAAIASRPDAWPTWSSVDPVAPPVRRYLMRHFPFAIGFRAFADHVVVVTVFHTSRRPSRSSP